MGHFLCTNPIHIFPMLCSKTVSVQESKRFVCCGFVSTILRRKIKLLLIGGEWNKSKKFVRNIFSTWKGPGGVRSLSASQWTWTLISHHFITFMLCYRYSASLFDQSPIKLSATIYPRLCSQPHFLTTLPQNISELITLDTCTSPQFLTILP